MALKIDNFYENHITQNFKSKKKHKKQTKYKNLDFVISQNHKPAKETNPILKPSIQQDTIEINLPKADSDIQKITEEMKKEHKNFSLGIIGKKLPDFIKYEPCKQVVLTYSNTVEKPLKNSLHKSCRYDDNWKRRAVFYETIDDTIYKVYTRSEFAYQDEKIPILKLIKYDNGNIDYINCDKWDSNNVFYDAKKQEFSYECQPRKESAVFDKDMNPKIRKKERQINWDGNDFRITHTTLFGKDGTICNIEEAWDTYCKDKLIFYRKSEYDKNNNETSRIILDTYTGKFIKKGIDF